MLVECAKEQARLVTRYMMVCTSIHSCWTNGGGRLSETMIERQKGEIFLACFGVRAASIEKPDTFLQDGISQALK